MTNDNKVREELIKKITLIKGASQNGMFGYLTKIEAGYIADFIIKDRKRVVKLLVTGLNDIAREKGLINTKTPY